MEDKNKQIAAKIKALRSAKNISQNTIAQKLNLTTTAYNRIENNKTQLTVNVLFIIAEVLEVSLADMLELTAHNIVHNNDSVVMTNFNSGHLHVNLTPSQLKEQMGSLK